MKITMIMARIKVASKIYGKAATKADSAVINRMLKMVYIKYTSAARSMMVTSAGPGPELIVYRLPGG